MVHHPARYAVQPDAVPIQPVSALNSRPSNKLVVQKLSNQVKVVQQLVNLKP